jgi:hypothetical protein
MAWPSYRTPSIAPFAPIPGLIARRVWRGGGRHRPHRARPGPNRIAMTLKAAMYLGERWELLFERDDLSVRAYADATAGGRRVSRRIPA